VRIHHRTADAGKMLQAQADALLGESHFGISPNVFPAGSTA
jgi:hypothetical protein